MGKKPSLSLFTDAEILAEAGRRRRAMLKSAPNPKVLRPCPKCEEIFGARELREHKPKCKGKS